MAIIGGNLADIEVAAGRLTESGQKAVASGESTKNATDQLAQAIEESMAQLLSRFTDIAAELKADVATSDERLHTAEWHGASRDAAVGIKQDLTSQINTVLSNATQNLEQFKSSLISQSSELVAHIDGDFRTVMTQVDEQYASLAVAARRTAENLEIADQTIRIA